MHRDIVVMGASAGGVEALCAAVGGLPEDLDAAVLVVLHLPPSAASVLPEVLQRRTTLPTAAAVDGEAVQHGRIYVARPDHHLRLRDSRIQLSRSAKENGHRPSIDTLFRSAARAFGLRVIGVILSGTLDDGAMGLRLVTAAGGAAVVQDPADAAFPGMPESALAAVPGATTAPADEVGKVIAELSGSQLEARRVRVMTDEAAEAADEVFADAERSSDGEPASVFTCPECHGTLFLNEEGDLTHFRCRVGHRFSAETLLASESEALEAALWTALRSLIERNDLMRRMAERALGLGQPTVAERFEARVREGDHNAQVLRDVLLSGETSREEPA